MMEESFFEFFCFIWRPLCCRVTVGLVIGLMAGYWTGWNKGYDYSESEWIKILAHHDVVRRPRETDKG